MPHQILALIFCLPFFLLEGCNRPPVPPEVYLVEIQEKDLWRDGADVYAAAEFITYRAKLRECREMLAAERARFIWFVNYESLRKEFSALYNRGQLISMETSSEQERRTGVVTEAIASREQRLEALAALADSINEGRVARRFLTRVEVLLSVSRTMLLQQKHDEAMLRLGDADPYLQQAEDALRRVAGRYADRKQIEHWRRLVATAKQGSQKNSGISILVSKLDRRLIVLKNGAEIRRYRVGLGRNGLKDKLYSGDQATPEGHYRVVKKNDESRFYKALLINYPNAEDMKRFASARKKGLVPEKSGIGSLLEIHGGGKDGITDGCVSLDNSDMAELFDMAETGTPITIVGVTDYENIVSIALGK
ncbi:MAG: L,D-transpeptidase [Proteobacteria bacterium]|nr:L,D-transpeptidase [Pseudomonadota bacterium]MBU1710641.1 L,D-transpeptidase [Pseudomonadota bacterium]